LNEINSQPKEKLRPEYLSAGGRLFPREGIEKEAKVEFKIVTIPPHK
jgi:hypothetical protein